MDIEEKLKDISEEKLIEYYNRTAENPKDFERIFKGVINTKDELEIILKQIL